MGLALCHGIPRDAVILLAIVLYVIAFVLEAIAIGRPSSKTSAGYLTNTLGADTRERILYIGGHPATYRGSAASNVAGAKLCNPSAETLRYFCARFAEGYHLLSGIILASFITCILFVFAALFFVVRVSRTSTDILFNLQLLAALPMALQCAAVGIFFSRVVPNATNDYIASRPAGDAASTRLKFHRGYACNLMIAAMALVCAGYLILLLKFIFALFMRAQLKKENVKQRDIDAVMKMHLVNDDWARQKQILRSHAKSVKVEMVIRQEDEGQFGVHVGGGSGDSDKSPRSTCSNPPTSPREGEEEASVDVGHRRPPPGRGAGDRAVGEGHGLRSGRPRSVGDTESSGAHPYSEAEAKTAGAGRGARPARSGERHEPARDYEDEL